MLLEDAPASATDLPPPPEAQAAAAPGAEGPAPPASLASIPLRRQRPRRAAAEAPAAAACESAPRRPEATASAGPAPQAARSAAPAAPSGGGDILALWKELRGDLRFPSWSELDFGRIAERWPNSLLLRFPGGAEKASPSLEARFSDAMRAAALRSLANGQARIEYTPLLTEWLIALSREAARAGRPVNDEQTLPAWRGPVRYRAIALPFSDDQAEIDHVLCHVAPA